MTDNHINNLLFIIRAGKDVSQLRSIGLEYSQIAQLITKAKKERLIAYRAGNLKITKKGHEFLEVHKRKLVYKENFIRPLNDMQIPKLGIDDIYLPPKEDLIT